MSQAFKSYGDFNLSKRGIGLVVTFIVFLIWYLEPYTELNCINGNCTLSRGKETLETFKTSDVDSCQSLSAQRRSCRRTSSHHRSCQSVTYYYPGITLANGRNIKISVFRAREASKVKNFCTALTTNSNYSHKSK